VGARGVEGVPRRCGGSGEAGRRRALAAPSRPPRHPLCGIYWFFFFACLMSLSAAGIFMCLVSVSIFCDCSHVYASPPAPASVCASVYAHTSVYVCELVLIRYGKASPGADFLPPTHTYTHFPFYAFLPSPPISPSPLSILSLWSRQCRRSGAACEKHARARYSGAG
jgi:hypothetical protein